MCIRDRSRESTLMRSPAMFRVMSARKVVEVRAFKRPSLLFGADPQPVKKRDARAVSAIMELIIFFI